MSAGKVTVGRILGAHGIRGELRLLPLTDFPDRFLTMKSLCLYRPDGAFLREAALEKIRRHEAKGTFLVSLEGIVDRDGAESLKGALVQINPEERSALPEGSYWIDDILGLEVFDEAGTRLGAIVEILPTGSNDVYLVEGEEGRRPLPAIAEVIRSVDLENRRLTVRIPEGLWD